MQWKQNPWFCSFASHSFLYKSIHHSLFKCKQLTSASALKSKDSLPTYLLKNLLFPSSGHPSNITRPIIRSITLRARPCYWLMVCLSSHCPKMRVSFRGLRAWPCLFQLLRAKFRQEPFFLLSSKGCNPVQRSERVGPVAKEESSSKAKPLVLIGLCKQQICLSEPCNWQAWEQWGLCRLHCLNETSSKVLINDRLYGAQNNTLIQCQDYV